MAEEIGLMPAPEGVTPDFHSITYLQRTIITVYSVTFAFATILLALRLYTGAFIVRKLGLDAPFIFLSWGVSLAFFIAMVLAMPAGFGRHLYAVTATQLTGYYNLLLVLAITYIWPPTLAKLAIVVLYHRINPSFTFRICCYVVGAALFVYTLVFTILFAGPCNPLTNGSGQCLNNIAVAQAVLNIVTDGVLILLPIPMIHKLNMPLKQKLVVGGILVLGSGVILASIVRVSYVQAMQNNPDVTHTQAAAAVWSCVELNVGIICNCLAMLKPFVRRHMPWLASMVGGNTDKASYNQQPSGQGNGSKPFGSGWRVDGANHSYQLHSVDRGRDSPMDKNNITIVDEYHVRYDRRKEGDASSTEDILPSDVEHGRPRK